MPKYVFSQGKVVAEEGVYLPILRKNRQMARVGVLLIIPSQPPEEETHASTRSVDKENAYGKPQ
jgi:hypothetical protein